MTGQAAKPRDTPAGATRLLAEWAASVTAERIPAADIERAKSLLLDFVRAVAIGAQTPWGAAARSVAVAEGRDGASSVLVFGDRLAPAAAAFANGSLAHSADIDDTHVGAMLHPAAAVTPAALAVAQDVDAGGDRLLAAVIAGYEVAIRVALAVQPAHFHQGFQATGTCGALGAAVASGVVLGFDADQMAGALGVSASSAGGLAQFYYSGSTVKRVHAGFAARSGVLAAQLVRAGIHGPHDVLEGAAGFGNAYADGLRREAIEDGLGHKLKLAEVTVKPHATSARCQAAVEAAMLLVREQRVAPGDIVAIEAGIPSVIAGRLTRSDVRDCSSAQMSLPYAVALAVVTAHERGPDQYLTVQDFESRLNDPEVRRLAAVTTCRVDERVEAETTAELVPGKVAVRRADGTEDERYVATPLGSPQRPLSADQWDRLFDLAVTPISSSDRAQRVAACVWGLDEADDMTALTAALEQLGVSTQDSRRRAV